MLAFIEQTKPEATFFVTEGGRRTGLFFFDMKDSSLLPSLAEPFFLNLNASVEVTPAMNADNLKAGLKRAGESAG